MSYLSDVLAMAEKKYADQPEFLQTVKEVLESLEPVIAKNEEKYKREALLERMIEPERQIMFRVPWVDDNGQIRVNTGSVFSSTALSVLTRAVSVSILP